MNTGILTVIVVSSKCIPEKTTSRVEIKDMKKMYMFSEFHFIDFEGDKLGLALRDLEYHIPSFSLIYISGYLFFFSPYPSEHRKLYEDIVGRKSSLMGHTTANIIDQFCFTSVRMIECVSN